MINSEMANEFIRERNEAVRSLDVKRFRAFYRKWQRRGVYKMPLPKSREVIEISMRKMVCNIESSTAEEKADAAAWLYRHGSNTDL